MNISESMLAISLSLTFLPRKEVSQLTLVSREWNQAAIKHITLLVTQSIGNIERIFSIYSCSHGARLQNLVDIRSCNSLQQVNDVASAVIIKIKFLLPIFNFGKAANFVGIENIFQLIEKIEECKQLGKLHVFICGIMLEHLSAGIRGDKGAVLYATSIDGRAVRHATEALRCDRDFMLAVVRNNPYALPYIREEFQRDEEFIEAVASHPKRDYRWSDGAFVLSALKGEIIAGVVGGASTIFGWAGEQLRNDREIILTAAQQNGFVVLATSLETIINMIINDREIMLTVVRQKEGVFRDVMLRLFGTGVRHHAKGNQKVALEQLQNDREIVLAAVRQDGMALQFASKSLQNDPEIVLAAVQQNGRALDFASDTLKRNRKIVKAAVRQFPRAWIFATGLVWSQYRIAHGPRSVL